MECFRDDLTSFCNASSQGVNFSKSLMYLSPNVLEHEALDLCESMGVPKTDDLGRYLGHRLIHKGRCGNGFDDLLQRVRDKLDGWKTGCLSRTAILTLAQSVLSNMGMFHMQLQRLPRRRHKELDMNIKSCA